MPGFTNTEPMWAITHEPADATQATISKAAATNATHHCDAISVSAEGAIAVGEVHFVLRDSTTGAGNILWQSKLTLGVAESKNIDLSGLNVSGVKGQALTLETVAAPAASQSATVTLFGHTVVNDA